MIEAIAKLLAFEVVTEAIVYIIILLWGQEHYTERILRKYPGWILTLALVFFVNGCAIAATLFALIFII